MRTILKVLGLLLVALLLFAFYIVYSTGYFRQIEPYFAGEIFDQIPVVGVEDMQLLASDSLLLLSADDRAARRDGDTIQGQLYVLDLRQSPWALKPLTTELSFPFYPHGISAIPTPAGSYLVYAINHVEDQHWVEQFELFGDSLVHRQTLRAPEMRSPNDLVALPGGRFYFTNDHGYTSFWGQLAEDYLGLAAADVIYFDGQQYQVVADGIAYANGINYDAGRQLLFVASPRDFLIKVYRAAADGQLTHLEDVKTGTGTDNLEFGLDGKLWAGGHPSLLAFAAYARGDKPYSPSEIITIDYRAPGDYSQELIYLEEGQTMAAASVAVPWGDYIFAGNVMDEAFLVLKRNN